MSRFTRYVQTFQSGTCASAGAVAFKETIVISAFRYYTEIVKPTVEEFFRNNKDLRLAMLACTVTLHVIDYVAQNKASNAREGQKEAEALKAKARTQFCFKVVEGFALASKHCSLSSQPGFDSGKHMVAYPSFAGVAVAGATFLGDEIGGITVHWTELGYVNLTAALKATLEYLDSEFPELTATPDPETTSLVGDVE
jgi:hypothetical protein